MLKNKVVGSVNIILGIFQSVFPAFFIFSTLPQLTEIYTQFETANQPNLVLLYLVILFSICTGVVNLFFGVKNLRAPKVSSEKYFTQGIIFGAVSFFLTGIIMGAITISIVGPMYNLTSEF